ncbi:hypothetical protein [Natronoglycomyces albus]|uniref:Uncharacterized protein n=1 Tax=Natronoglycomyces albus TaxID=2811108 RepID=A0A895XPU5_9ACTN|nr:hypothetical protein [Natronoglycomyces albus]QSB07197.1 hypothetical protein JQS30_16975 [Natronoglycomyces albus]
MAEYIEQWMYDITAVNDLPYPTELDAPPCIARGITGFGRTWRQIRPRPQPRDCCWYHGGSWQEAFGHAIEIIKIASGQTENEIRVFSGETLKPISIPDPDEVEDLLEYRQLSGWLSESVTSLLSTDEPINIGGLAELKHGDLFYIGGRHRAMAMIQQGTRATITMRLELFDPETGELIFD